MASFAVGLCGRWMERMGIEPTTPCLQSKDRRPRQPTGSRFAAMASDLTSDHAPQDAGNCRVQT